MVKRGKKAAMELSMSTIVVLVIAMTMLVLGIVFVRNIFNKGTASLDAIDDQVMSEIKNLFPNEDDYILIKLNEERVAKIKAGTADFGIGVFARTPEGDTVDRATFRYKLSLDTGDVGNCVEELGMKRVEEMFNKKFGVFNQFTDFQGDNAGVRIGVTIPEATKLCSQVVLVDLFNGEEGIASKSFTIQIQRKGFF